MALLFKVSMFLPRFCESWLVQMGGWRGPWEERLYFFSLGSSLFHQFRSSLYPIVGERVCASLLCFSSELQNFAEQATLSLFLLSLNGKLVRFDLILSVYSEL